MGKKVACSCSHEEMEYSFSAAVTEEGRLFMWGNVCNGKLGNGCCEALIQREPTQVLGAFGALAETTVEAVALGESHVLAVAGGRVFAWGHIGNCIAGNGRLGNGRLGLGTGVRGAEWFDATYECLKFPTEIKGALFQDKRIIQVAAGVSHSLFLGEDGSVFTSGEDGLNTCWAPTLIEGALVGLQVTEIGCGEAFSAVLTQEGRVFTWGSNANGLLGQGCEADAVAKEPAEVKGALSGKKVTAVACGRSHTLALANGEVVGWGRGMHLCLDQSKILEPTAVGAASALAGRQVVGISCSALFSLARTNDGAVFRFGEVWDAAAEDYIISKEPTQIPGLLAVDFACGDGHFLLVSPDGKLFACGDNGVGQLGLGLSHEHEAVPTQVEGFTGRVPYQCPDDMLSECLRCVIADRCALFTEIEVLQKEVGAADAERAELQDRFVSAELDTLKSKEAESRLRGVGVESMTLAQLSVLQQEQEEACARVATQILRSKVVDSVACMHKAYVCPMSFDLMKDPVVAADGHTYERQKILEWIELQQKKGCAVHSPLSSDLLANTTLIPNIAMKTAIREAIDAAVQAAPGATSKRKRVEVKID